jgi:tyrosinase
LSVIARLNIRSLERSDKEQQLKDVRRAYKLMMEINDNRGYGQVAGFHGLPDWYCWHHQRNTRTTMRARLFLPWHRAYLYWFEQYLQDQVSGVTVPYWDWTDELSHSSQSNGIPKPFNDPTVNGDPNPLYKYQMNIPTANPPVINQDTIRNPWPPSELPTDEQVQAVLNLSDFGDFNDGLEDIHDNVHGWFAREGADASMARVAFAAYDPIFWSHHCMIDRLWYLWQNKWGREKGLEAMLDASLTPFGDLKVKNIISIYDLGYTYAGNEISVSAGGED